MKIIKGVYTSAKVFTVNTAEHALDPYAVSQIQMLCDNKCFKNCKIRVMPDVHPGKVSTIGFTSSVGTRIMPNVIGIDIGCGITLAKLKQKKCEFQKLDSVIREHVPSGSSLHSKPHHLSDALDLQKLRCYPHIQERKAKLSLGTLGGGNHFIEIDADDDGFLYSAIHSGSRHLGKEVTEHYLKAGQNFLKENGIQIPYELTYLEGTLMKDYLHDLRIVQEFAAQNRQAILATLSKHMKWKIIEFYSCIHNYVDFASHNIAYENLDSGFSSTRLCEADSASHNMILRKGAISAKKDEPVIIPVNMRDGILLGRGLGNEDWNLSAPHGAGRIYKREDVKTRFTVSAYKTAMKGIYSTCIGKSTLDEAPFAYRTMDAISEAIADTVMITQRLRPIYNFKAGDMK